MKHRKTSPLSSLATPMDPPDIKILIADVLEGLVDLDKIPSSSFFKHVALLADALATDAYKLGLTGYDTPEAVARALIGPALLVLRWVDVSQPADILDVGTGSGVTGLTLALAAPPWHVTLLDRRERSVAFCEVLAVRLGLRNIKAVLGDALHKIEDLPPADAALFRAVAGPAQDLGMAENLLRPGGLAILWSAANTHWPGREGWQQIEVIRIHSQGPAVAAYQRSVVP